MECYNNTFEIYFYRMFLVEVNPPTTIVYIFCAIGLSSKCLAGPLASPVTSQAMVTCIHFFKTYNVREIINAFWVASIKKALNLLVISQTRAKVTHIIHLPHQFPNLSHLLHLHLTHLSQLAHITNLSHLLQLALHVPHLPQLAHFTILSHLLQLPLHIPHLPQLVQQQQLTLFIPQIGIHSNNPIP